MKINVCLIQPSGYIHSLALLEAAEYIVFKCRAEGYDAELRINTVEDKNLNVIFGSHILPSQINKFPQKTIIFNTEQLPENSSWVSIDYKSILDKHHVWDYSPINLDLIGHRNKALINFYYTKGLHRISLSNKRGYDLLFYGSVNPRREKILTSLEKKGLKIKKVFGIYGKDRDSMMSNSSAVLNLHYYDSQIFQQIRTFYPLINGVPVISEDFPVKSAPSIYESTVFHPKGSDFEEYVCNLFKQNDEFHTQSQEKINAFKNSMGNTEFKNALKDAIAQLQN